MLWTNLLLKCCRLTQLCCIHQSIPSINALSFLLLHVPPSLPPSLLPLSLPPSIPACLPSFLPSSRGLHCPSPCIVFFPGFAVFTRVRRSRLSPVKFLGNVLQQAYMYLHVAYVKLLVCITCRPSAGPIANHSQTACLTLIPMSAVTAPPSQDVDRPMDVQDLHWRPSNTCPSLDFGAARPLNSAQ